MALVHLYAFQTISVFTYFFSLAFGARANSVPIVIHFKVISSRLTTVHWPIAYRTTYYEMETADDAIYEFVLIVHIICYTMFSFFFSLVKCTFAFDRGLRKISLILIFVDLLDHSIDSRVSPESFTFTSIVEYLITITQYENFKFKSLDCKIG